MSDSEVIFVSGERRVTRGEHRDRSARAATVLRDRGVGADDCIGVALRNRPEK